MTILKKLKIKSLIGTIIQFGGIIVLSLLFNRFIEVLIIIPLFFIFRLKYEKTFHAETIRQCTTYTLLMFLIICLISKPITESILLAIIFCFLTTEILYFLKDYIDLKKVKKIKISKRMNKEDLKAKCKMEGLTDLETKVLILYYCDGLKRWQIANELNYSEETIGRIKRKALEKLN